MGAEASLVFQFTSSTFPCHMTMVTVHLVLNWHLPQNLSQRMLILKIFQEIMPLLLESAAFCTRAFLIQNNFLAYVLEFLYTCTA